MPGKQIGNQFYDLERVDWACIKIKKRKRSLISISIVFFLLKPTIEFIVIKIETCNPSLLYYLTLRMLLIWLRIWLVSNKIGTVLKSVGKL